MTQNMGRGGGGVPPGNGPADNGPHGNGPDDNGPHGNGPHGNGPYGQGPYGWGGWMPPPPPKPGVIPLAPLTLGAIFGGSLAIMGRYWKQLFGLVAAVFAGALLLVVAAAAIAYTTVSGHLRALVDAAGETDPPWDDIRPLGIAFVCVWLFAMVLYLVATAMVQAACPTIVQAAVLGRPTTFGAVWRRTLSRFPAVLGATFLSGLVAIVPMVLLVLVVAAAVATFAVNDDLGQLIWLLPVGFLGYLALAPVAVWLWIRFSLAPAAAVIESQRPVAALRRSTHLVRGSWWRIFGISGLAGLMVSAASIVVGQLVNLTTLFPGTMSASDLPSDPDVGQVLASMGGFFAVALIFQLIWQVLVATFPQLVISLLYMDQRIRKENLAQALITATAGGHTTPPPAPGQPSA
ncbi:oxidoreductase [Streptomyces sp. NPDC051569]|uniref:DUF7847 domain-containing protein n=1 Tax=Streptomyces sp. NPDC051569 TaxID=3365661 RepID=UPI0037A4CA8F